MEQINYFISGASGFIGGQLCDFLKEQGHHCLKVSRKVIEQQDSRSLHSPSSKGKKVFIHLAARVHNTKCHDDQLYYRDNVVLSKKAIELAKNLGCSQFIFMSTIKVFGEVQTEPYTEATTPLPKTAYGRSKLTAEQELISLNQSLKMRLDMVRIPLVIDMNAKGNIETLVKVVKKGVPLPFGLLTAPRAFVFRGELIQKLYDVSLMESQHASENLHLVCQQEGMSTSSLLRWIGQNLGKQVRLVPVPLSMLKFFALIGDLGGYLLNKKLPFNSDVFEKIALPMEMVPKSTQLVSIKKES